MLVVAVTLAACGSTGSEGSRSEQRRRLGGEPIE